MTESEKTYPRFTLSQRLQHWIMTLSFVTLAVTGLPQRYALSPVAEGVIAILGGIETVRIIHRVAATVFILVTLFHFVAIAYRVLVLRVRMSMLPTFKDAIDLLDSVRYNLGLAKNHPKFPRFSVAEKIEYWALIWGSLIMILTGFMLWNPIATTRFLPGEFIPAAKAAHSAEALLAVLAVIIWHFYWVHLKTFNRSIFTGKLTRKQMEEEHAAELEEIEAGTTQAPLPREVKRRRERVFLPVASVISLALTASVLWFLTFEQTAITTVPPAETAQAFVPATPTPTNTPSPTATPSPTPTATPTVAGAEEETPPPTESEATPGSEMAPGAPVIPHALEDREDCLLCHGPEGVQPFPADHEGRELNTCLVCHTTQGVGPLAVPVKHSLEEREDCLLCHTLDLLPESHQEAEFASPDCLTCHSTAESNN